MSDRSGCLAHLDLAHLWRLLVGSPEPGARQAGGPLPIRTLPPTPSFTPSPDPEPPRRTPIPLFALPGHGRTSFLWATIFTMRRLSRVWRGCVCRADDEATGRALRDVHESLHGGVLPPPWAEGDEAARYALRLRNVSPWGDRRVILHDAPDPAFTAGRVAATSGAPPSVDWSVPGLWVLSLNDLDRTSGRFPDLGLDELVRAREAAVGGEPGEPYRLVVALAKADALTELPRELRALLADDPLARVLDVDREPPRRDDADARSASPSQPSGRAARGDPVHAYFRSRNRIHTLARDWLTAHSPGRFLLSRAEELGVEVKLSVVSATGSGFALGRQLATAWSPRRILDPYFWCLELGA